MITKKKIITVILLSLTLLWSTASIYAGDSLADCGPNLSTNVGGDPYSIDISVKDMSGIKDMYLYSNPSTAPWDSIRTSVEEIHIHAGVRNITSMAFYNMKAVKTVYLPKSLEIIADGAFSGCNNIQSVFYSGTTDEWYKLKSNIKSENDTLLAADVYCMDKGTGVFELIGMDGKSKRIDWTYCNYPLMNALDVLENAGKITLERRAVTSYADLDNDGTNDLGYYLYSDEGTSGILPLPNTNLKGKTFTVQIDKTKDIPCDGEYPYYGTMTFVFPQAYDGDKGAFTVDLSSGKTVLNNADADALFYSLHIASKIDKSVKVVSSPWPDITIDLNVDGKDDLFLHFGENDDSTLTKLVTCSVDGELILLLSEAAKISNNKNEYDYFSKVTFHLKEEDKISKGTPIDDAEPVLLNATEDDVKGSSFCPLQASATKTLQKSITLSWKKVKGANSYTIYGGQCGSKMQKIDVTILKKMTIKKIGKKKLKPGNYYKFVVVATDKNGKILSVSKTVHASTSGKQFGNITSVTPKKAQISIKAGKSKKVKVKTEASGTVKTHRDISWESDNPAVATVSSDGKIAGVAKGKCNVYAYAQNGVCGKVVVVVN